MEERVILKISDSVYGEIEIPFLGLQELDLFTVRYENKEELVRALSSMLELSISLQSVKNIYVSYEYQDDRVKGKNNGYFKQAIVPIKYRSDNFDIGDIENAFSTYLKQDIDRVNRTGVRKVRTKAMLDFVGGEGTLSNFDIDTAVKMYFDGAPYRIFRKIYFMIKGQVYVKKNGVVFEERKNIDRSLSKFSSDDDYIDSLLQYALKGEEETDRVMEELSLMDLEELSSRIKNPHYGVFDGVDVDNYVDLQDLKDLEKYSGYTIPRLVEMISSGRRKR